MNNPYPSETGCCPKFDPAPWDEKEIQWDNKLFIKDKVFCFMHIPLNFGKVIVRCLEKIEKAGAHTRSRRCACRIIRPSGTWICTSR